MSALDDIKAALRVTHNSDDAMLLRLAQSASYEALNFLDTGVLSSSGFDGFSSSTTIDDLIVPPDHFQAVVLLVSADYDAPPDKRTMYRAAAEQLLMPYREIGI